MRVQTRFLILLGLRWLPVGLLIPVTVLLGLQRGLTIAEIGSVAAIQGILVLILELPTGGLSDALGRKPVLIVAGVIDLAALGLLSVAHSVAAFAAYYVLQGIFRALDSGPLESWYVDHALAAAPEADIETGLSRSGVVLGVAIAGGALLSGGIVAIASITTVVYVAIGIQVVGFVALLLLMTEDRPARGLAALRASIRGVPAAIGGALRIVRKCRVVAALIAVELFWGFGMATFETLMPVRVSEILGDQDKAAALMGPAGSAAWAASAAGAALIPLLSRRIGAPWTGFTLRIAQGLTVAGMAWAGGVAGLLTAYLLCYAVHGAANPVHVGLLHRQVDGPYRGSLLSLNSMVSQPAGSLGLVVLTAIAAGSSISMAMLVGAAVLALAAPLYLVRNRVHGGVSVSPASG